MRIIGYIEDPDLKITVFKMEDRISLKLENSLLEQTYKFRGGLGLDTLESVKQFADTAFLQQAKQEMKTLAQIRQSGLDRLHGGSLDEFEQII